MPPHTSPPNCTGCFSLSQKIAELERRISTLYQIQDSERLLDTLAAEASRLAENTTLPWLGPSHISDSTSASVEPWSVVRGKRPGRANSRTPPSGSTPPSETIQLGNRFDVLEKLERSPLYSPELPVGSALDPTDPAGAGARRPGAAGHRAPLRPARGRSSTPGGKPGRQPTTLVIGDSIILNIRSGSAITCCFPGATVRDITNKATEILAARPEITTVIIHAGTNDICRPSS